MNCTEEAAMKKFGKGMDDLEFFLQQRDQGRIPSSYFRRQRPRVLEKKIELFHFKLYKMAHFVKRRAIRSQLFPRLRYQILALCYYFSLW